MRGLAKRPIWLNITKMGVTIKDDGKTCIIDSEEGDFNPDITHPR